MPGKGIRSCIAVNQLHSLKVFHIDPEKGWRGGQQQAAYLHEGLVAQGISSWVVCRPGGPFEEYLKSKGLPHIPIAMRNEGDFIAGWHIARAAKAHNVSILHLHSSHALAIGLWASLFNKELKLIGVRRVDFPIRKNSLSRFKYMTPRMTRHVAISNKIREVMVEDGIPSDRITTIHSGVDIHRFLNTQPPEDFRRVCGIPEDHLVVGTVAALAGHKDYPTLLKSAAQIVKKYDKVTFCALGDGPDEVSIHHLANELGLGDRFRFMGYRKDVGEFLKTFDIFVLASHMEGLGTSILDAQAVGLPVLASRAGGIPEIVEDGVSGLLAEAKNPDDFTTKLSMLIEDGALRKTLGKGALESVKNFSIERTVEKNIALYHEILNSDEK